MAGRHRAPDQRGRAPRGVEGHAVSSLERRWKFSTLIRRFGNGIWQGTAETGGQRQGNDAGRPWM